MAGKGSLALPAKSLRKPTFYSTPREFQNALSLIVIDSSYDGLTIYYPQYSSVNLECNSASPESDSNAIFACAAAFTDSEGRVMGDYVSHGSLHSGNRSSYGCFV